jgi:transcription initiation factor TFIIF subunit alpha
VVFSKLPPYPASQAVFVTQERLKREYKSANKRREGYVDESDEDDNEVQLSKEGKAMKKLIRNLEKNNAYDSDEERNPYASSVSNK